MPSAIFRIWDCVSGDDFVAFYVPLLEYSHTCANCFECESELEWQHD
jgi:hypothetical protein